jgi:hypothetical protein
LQRAEDRRKKEREKKMKLRGLGPASLSQLCLERIVHAIDYFESFSGKLPQELLYELLAKLGENKKLSDKTIAKVLDPSLQRFVLKGPCASVTDLTMFQLSRRCKGLQELHLVSCFTISDRSMQQVIPNSPELEHIVINNCPQIGNLVRLTVHVIDELTRFNRQYKKLLVIAPSSQVSPLCSQCKSPILPFKNSR